MKEDRYSLHIRDAVAQIGEYPSGGGKAFFHDRKTRDAISRQLEIVGEAGKIISDVLKADHPERDRRAIAGLRDVLIHKYFGVKLDVVWEVVDNRLPAFRNQLRPVLQAPESRRK